MNIIEYNHLYLTAILYESNTVYRLIEPQSIVANNRQLQLKVTENDNDKREASYWRILAAK